MSSAVSSSSWLKVVTPIGYCTALAAIGIAWSIRDQNLIRADDGLGYLLGIVGASLMLLLLIYPLRKRVPALSRLGSVRFWFRIHMLFGVLGPVLILLHSNFNLGSLNGRVALFCTLVVAASGVLGRYLYAKIHYGLYGQRATLTSLQNDLATGDGNADRLGLAQLINARLQLHEQRAMAQSRRGLTSVAGMALTPVRIWWLEHSINRELAAAVDEKAACSSVIAEHRDRLLATARGYLSRRLASFRKLAQLTGCERLFSLWHIVHFPLFLVMVAAAVIHVVAVHAY
jgi:hypothetical protein